ncbi:methylmalonyl-CoA mutase family protein [Caulobacter segnis]
MMRDEFGATSERSLSVAITSHTSGLSLTAQQPANNIVRGTLQALSLVLGGVQALEISAFDEAYRTPSEEAHLVGAADAADHRPGIRRRPGGRPPRRLLVCRGAHR